MVLETLWIIVIIVTITMAKAQIIKAIDEKYFTLSRSASREMPITAEAIRAESLTRDSLWAPNLRSFLISFPSIAFDLLKYFLNRLAHGVNLFNACVDQHLAVTQHQNMVKAALKVVHHVS